MPRYRFAHPFRELFTDLQHGVNALVHRAGENVAPSPAGSTVVLAPGDELETPAIYLHPHLDHVSDEVSEAAAMLPGAGRDEATQRADALKAERSSDGSVIAAVAASGEHDTSLPGRDLLDTSKVLATDAAIDPEALNAAVTTNLGEHAGVATPADAPGNLPAETPAVEVEAAPVVETPAVETPAAPVVETPAAPVVETPAAAAVPAPAAPEAPAAS